MQGRRYCPFLSPVSDGRLRHSDHRHRLHHLQDIRRSDRRDGLPDEVLMKLLNALQVEASEFLVETGYMKPITAGGKGKRIPVISWVRAGRWKEVREQEEPGKYLTLLRV